MFGPGVRETSYNQQVKGQLNLFLHIPHAVFQTSLTCTKSKKVRLVRISLQQGRDTASHSLVAFVDELLAEVAVNLLGRHAVVSRQRAVDEVRQLRER